MTCERCKGSGYDPEPASVSVGAEGACSACDGRGKVYTEDEQWERDDAFDRGLPWTPPR